MSVSVAFYTFSKKINSTSKPTGAGTSFSCLLREPTSIQNPTIVLQTSNPTAYNYAYISDFGGRYYFVTDWTSHKGQWIAQLKVDVLATYSTTIKNSSQFVVRSASVYDEYLTDKFYPAHCNPTYEKANWSGTNLTDHSDISFVVGILGKAGGSNTIGPVTYYSMTGAGLANLLNYMMTTYNTWSGISSSDLVEGMQKAILNPFQYITCCFAMPFAAIQTNSVSSITFGPYEYNATGYIIPKNTVIARSQSFTLDKHPQAASYGKYLNASPFTEYTLYCGPFGEIPIETASLVDESTLDVTIAFDAISGDATLYIVPGNSAKKAFYKSAHVGVEIPVSSWNSNPFESTIANEQIIGNIPFTLNAGKIMANIDQSILNYAQSKMPEVRVSGSQGSFIGWYYPTELRAKFYSITDPDNFHFGRPYNRISALTTLSGFTLIDNPAIAINGTEEEQSTILNYMTSGFFLE